MSSAASEQDTLVERESVVALPRRVPTAVAQPEPVRDPAPLAVQAPPPPKADHAFVGVLAALASLLAARLLLLLSIAGAFVLALLATRSESYPGLAILVAFCLLTVVPLTYLDVVTHRRGGQ